LVNSSPVDSSPGDPCPGQKRCDGVCIPRDQCCTQADCSAGSLCCNGVCSATLLATGENCFQDSDLCCSNYCHIDKDANDQFVFTCAASCRSRACADDSECCRGEPCLRLSTGAPRCGGCGHSLDPCTSDAECCFSACTANANPIFIGKQCQSYPGGPCQSNIDCRSCYVDDQCNIGLQDICHAGVCGCPYACCDNGACPPGKVCKRDTDGLNGTCQDIVIG
jgi:hypothetical protein